MRYEVYIDILKGDKKVLSSNGNIVGLTNELIKVIEHNGINLNVFSDFLVDYIKDNQNLFNIHVSGKPFSFLCPNTGIFLELWITNAEKSTQHFLALINYSGDVQISISRPELFDRVIYEIMRKSLQFLDCLRVEMPFLYRFVIFELFNSFKKLSKVRFEGKIENNIVVADYKDRGLIWEIDSTSIDYTSSISKKILPPY